METALQPRTELQEWQKKILTDYFTIQSSVSKSESRIILANSQTPTIRSLLKTLPDHEFDQKFREILVTIAAMAGIKTPPDGLTKSLLFSYFTTSLVGYTFEDIRLAFMMNSARELPVRIEHYDLLDINFLSGVMEQYLQMKIAAHRRVTSLLKPPPEPTITDEDSFDGLVDHVKKSGKIPQFWAWSRVYNYLDVSGKIKESVEQKKQLYRDTFARMNSQMEMELLEVKDIIERGKRIENLPNAVQHECRKIMVHKFLKKFLK